MQAMNFTYTLTLAQEKKPPTSTQTGEGSTAGQNGAQPGTETPGAPAGPNTTAPAPPNPFGGSFIWIMLLVLVVFWVFAMSGQRKEKKKRQNLIASMKKGDKVQTIGGIIGSLVEVRDNYVVVKVDENSNTRMRFTRGAIQNVISDDGGDSDAPKKPE